MKPSKLYEALHALIGERVPLHIWGACGVGKSQIVSQVASDLDYGFLDVRAVQLDPVDLRGTRGCRTGARRKEDPLELRCPHRLGLGTDAADSDHAFGRAVLYLRPPVLVV